LGANPSLALRIPEAFRLVVVPGSCAHLIRSATAAFTGAVPRFGTAILGGKRLGGSGEYQRRAGPPVERPTGTAAAERVRVLSFSGREIGTTSASGKSMRIRLYPATVVRATAWQRERPS